MKHARGLSLWAMLGAVLLWAPLLARGAPGEKPEVKPEKADAEGKKLPKAGKDLVEAFKHLTKAKSYKVSVSIEGGLSDNPEHKVTTANVRESYVGDLFRNQSMGQLMHLPAMRVFRTTEAGAIESGGWKRLLSDRAGVKMHRLFTFPETILERATRYQAAAQWADAELDSSKSKDETGENAGDQAKTDEEVGGQDKQKSPPGAKGKTIVVERGKSGKTEVSALPHIIRVEAPTKEALAHFLEVENSGCFGGG